MHHLYTLAILLWDRDKETVSTALHIAAKLICNWICIDDTNGAFRFWSIYGKCGSIEWCFETIFTSSDTAVLFQILYPAVDVQIFKFLYIDLIIDTLCVSSIHGMDTMFIP